MAREMVDSGQVWLGQIPKGWNIGKIGGLYKLRNTKVSDKDYPALSVTKNGIVPQLETAAKTNDGDNRKLVRIGDFAINSRSDRRGSCGISPYDGSVSLIVTVLEPREEMNPRYYDWLFHTKEFADEFYANGRGIVDDLWTTNWQNMKRISVVVPPLPEQQKIAAFLDDKCAEFDSLIADIQREIDKLERLRRSVIAEAVTKGLDKNAEMKDSGIEWLGKIPKDWQVKAFRFILNERNEKNIPIKTDERLSLSIDIGITLYAEKTTNLDRFKEDVSQYKIAHIGDLVLNSMNVIVGAEGISKYFGCISPAYYTYYDNDEKHYDARFCDYVFKCKRLRNLLFTLGKGIMAIERGDGRVNTCRLKVSRDDIGHLKFPFPSKEERIQIVDYLDARCAEFDTILSEKQKQLEILQKLKKSVIYEYVTGKKEVK